jgi:hypothetical protein
MTLGDVVQARHVRDLVHVLFLIVGDATGTRLKQHARRQRCYLRRQPLPAS